jgi:hypothetical protein
LSARCFKHEITGERTYAKLDRDGEEVAASLLLDLLATRNSIKVDEAGLDEALCALSSLEQLLGEPAEKIR